MFVVTDERFEELATEALQSIPGELAAAMDNVVIIVEDEAVGRNLFGLYEGVPLTKRQRDTMPDRITLYQTTICSHCTSEDEVRAQVRKTLIHEVGHHFGLGESRLRELGWA